MHNPVNAFGVCFICACHWFSVLWWINKRFRITGVIMLKIHKGKKCGLFLLEFMVQITKQYLFDLQKSVGTQVSMCECQICGVICARASGYHPYGPRWFVGIGLLEQGGLSCVMWGISSQGANFTRCCLSLLSFLWSRLTAWLAPSIRFPYYSCGPLHLCCHK